MSRHKLPVNLSPEAWDDLEDIAFDQALLRLGDFPQLGRPRDELHPGYRSLLMEQHIAIYEVLPSEVYVIRILHRGRDLRQALRE